MASKRIRDTVGIEPDRVVSAAIDAALGEQRKKHHPGRVLVAGAALAAAASVGQKRLPRLARTPLKMGLHKLGDMTHVDELADALRDRLTGRENDHLDDGDADYDDDEEFEDVDDDDFDEDEYEDDGEPEGYEDDEPADDEPEDGEPEGYEDDEPEDEEPEDEEPEDDGGFDDEPEDDGPRDEGDDLDEDDEAEDEDAEEPEGRARLDGDESDEPEDADEPDEADEPEEAEEQDGRDDDREDPDVEEEEEDIAARGVDLGVDPDANGHRRRGRAPDLVQALREPPRRPPVMRRGRRTVDPAARPPEHDREDSGSSGRSSKQKSKAARA